MKKIVKILLFFFLFVPFMVDAAQYTYNGAISRANNYINSYDTRSKYILIGPSYEFKDGSITPNNSFVNGGFLNKVEFEIGGRYLSPGAEYWTMSEVPNSTHIYTVSNILRSDKNPSDQAGVRVTEYVKPSVQVGGNGTKAHPWEFKESYIVYIGSNDVNKGTVSDNEIQVPRNGDASLTLNPNLTQGYRYKVSTCGLSYNMSTKIATIRNVTKDINCLVIFDNQIYTFDLTDTRAQTQANPSSIILEYRNTWFSDTNLAHKINQVIIPKRLGYTFKGFKFGTTDVIDQNGNILRTVDIPNLTTLNYKMEAQWQAIKYTCSAGTYLPKGTINCTSCKTGYYCPGGDFYINYETDQGMNKCPDGYNSAVGTSSQNRCYISIGDGKYLGTPNSTVQSNCPAGTFKAAHSVYYGNTSSCTNCTAGTYSTGGAKQCTNCPSGYTSVEGTTAENKCYITVEGGKYIKTAKSTTKTNCPAGQFNPEHKVNYGSTSACSTCTEGKFSGEGASSCSNCPNGYTSAAGANAQSKCYINVGDGKYIKDVNSSTQTNCPAGTAKSAHTVYYGNKSACDTCGTGKYSTEGSKQCSPCPSGYTSAAGSTAQTKCYIEVGAGKYKTSATGTATASCGANSFKAKHNSYYNSSDTCDPCPSGYKNGGGGTANTSCYIEVAAGKYKTSATGTATSNCGTGKFKAKHNSYYNSSDACDPCPSGYTSDGGATVNTSCYINVGDGKYKTSATGSTTDKCKAGTFKTAHKSYYNSGDSCGNCSAGTYSDTGAKQCTACPGGKTSSAGSGSCPTNCTNSAGVASWSSSCNVSSCSANYYKNGNACSACPSGTISPAGSTSSSQCVTQWVYAFSDITSASQGTTNWSSLNRPVFVRFNAGNLSERYVCITFNTSTPVCYSRNAYYNDAEWEAIATLFKRGRYNCNHTHLQNNRHNKRCITYDLFYPTSPACWTDVNDSYWGDEIGCTIPVTNCDVYQCKINSRETRCTKANTSNMGC